MALITNHGGGYWFDAVRRFDNALEWSLVALRELGREPVVSERDRGAIEAAEEALERLKMAVEGPK